MRHRRAMLGFLSRTGTSIGLSGLQRNPTEGLGCGMGMGRATGWLCVVMAFAGGVPCDADLSSSTRCSR